MKDVHVGWYSAHPETPNRGFWTGQVVEDIFDGTIWDPPGRPDVIHDEHADLAHRYDIVVVPADRHQWEAAQIGQRLVGSPITMLFGDEGSEFDTTKIRPPRWVQYPHRTTVGETFIGLGYTPLTRPTLAEYAAAPTKDLTWFFGGQRTHSRRDALCAQLAGLPDGQLIESSGFAEGIDQAEYIRLLARAVVAPCPSGPVTTDSFRLYEALEAGCIPIVDLATPTENARWFWEKLYPDADDELLPRLTHWEFVRPLIDQLREGWPRNANRTFAWWQRTKRRYAMTLWDQLADLRGEPGPYADITAVVTTSPVERHPDTSHLIETVESIRERLPHEDILIVFDGVRPEQAHLAERYDEYVRQALWLCNHRWRGVYPVVCDQFGHQANALRAALEHVRTRHILFSEHDTPLFGPNVPWEKMVKTLDDGAAHLIRLPHEGHMIDEHEYLMLGDVEELNGVEMRRTIQWSQRPHLASVEFYRRILDEQFAPESRTMIEDLMASVVQVAYQRFGISGGWNRYRVWLYTPVSGGRDSLQRSRHLDSREGAPKYEMKWTRFPDG